MDAADIGRIAVARVALQLILGAEKAEDVLVLRLLSHMIP
jgi:hypothetical protein